jgi:saccharopine dehydrogenase-like NADP-dependent oxidoreductase
MNILVFGAGRSAYYTIEYLLQRAPHSGWNVTIADSYEENLLRWNQNYAHATTRLIDVHDEGARKKLVSGQNIVISLLPARFHILLAHDCLAKGVHLITPSYITPEFEWMHEDVKQKGLIFMNELGLDPGIDHMSSMHIIDSLSSKGAEITSYKSYTGGLIAKEDDNNPWHYKFSWNPYNVVRAGADGAVCMSDGRLKYVPYHKLFLDIDNVEAEGEVYDAYLNRNSLRYIKLYGLESARTFLRGTLRYAGFCNLWHYLVDIGLTNDRLVIETDKAMPWDEYFRIFDPGMDVARKEAFAWLLRGAQKIGIGAATPAENLQKLLESKWKLEFDDKDRVVMIHLFEYTLNGKKHQLKSWLDMTGEDAHRTAMAKTVGYPLALAAELIANNKISTHGVLMPTIKEVYVPLLEELRKLGIGFKEVTKAL